MLILPSSGLPFLKNWKERQAWYDYQKTEKRRIDRFRRLQSPEKVATAIDCVTAVRCRFDGFKNLILSNVFVLGSPWESDVIKVTKNQYWYEFEIKVSIHDYRADFRKTAGYRDSGIKKHDFLVAGNKPRIPRPRQFFFVTPEGLLDRVKIPPHCGLIEVAFVNGNLQSFEKKRAKVLKNPSKLAWNDLFNLSLKASRK